MELWDAYDEKFNRVSNVTLIRNETIPDGLFHLVCDIIVKHTDGDYLLMQRDSRKNFGGLWEATAGGSALKGETPLDCAIRELYEETGIYSKHLTELGRVISKKNHSLYVEFSCLTNCPKNSIVLQDGETCDYKWISKSKLIALPKNKLLTERVQMFIKELRL